MDIYEKLAQFTFFSHLTAREIKSFAKDLKTQAFKTEELDHRIRIFGTAGQIIARYLWNQGRSFGEKFESGVLVRKQVNKTLLARSLGLSRRQIIREFEILEKAKLLEIQGTCFFFPDLSKLLSRSNEAWFERRKAKR